MLVNIDRDMIYLVSLSPNVNHIYTRVWYMEAELLTLET